MLPFLKPRKQADAVIQQTIKPDGEKQDEAKVSDEAISRAEAILSAIAMQDATALAKALES